MSAATSTFGWAQSSVSRATHRNREVARRVPCRARRVRRARYKVLLALTGRSSRRHRRAHVGRRARAIAIARSVSAPGCATAAKAARQVHHRRNQACCSPPLQYGVAKRRDLRGPGDSRIHQCAVFSVFAIFGKGSRRLSGRQKAPAARFAGCGSRALGRAWRGRHLAPVKTPPNAKRWESANDAD